MEMKIEKRRKKSVSEIKQRLVQLENGIELLERSLKKLGDELKKRLREKL